jgi:hypothetical protein
MLRGCGGERGGERGGVAVVFVSLVLGSECITASQDMSVSPIDSVQQMALEVYLPCNWQPDRLVALATAS